MPVIRGRTGMTQTERGRPAVDPFLFIFYLAAGDQKAPPNFTPIVRGVVGTI